MATFSLTHHARDATAKASRAKSWVQPPDEQPDLEDPVRMANDTSNFLGGLHLGRMIELPGGILR